MQDHIEATPSSASVVKEGQASGWVRSNKTYSVDSSVPPIPLSSAPPSSSSAAAALLQHPPSAPAPTVPALSKQHGKQLRKILQSLLKENPVCADCSAKDPRWLSLANKVMVCDECSGVHYNMGSPLKHSTSLSLELVELGDLSANGNQKVNAVLEHSLGLTCKPGPDASYAERERWIVQKYKERAFSNGLPYELGVLAPRFGIVKSGFVDQCYKDGKKESKWERRYLVLTDRLLTFYNLPADMEALGMVELMLCTVKQRSPTEDGKESIAEKRQTTTIRKKKPKPIHDESSILEVLVPSESKSLILVKCSNAKEATEWKDAIEKVSLSLKRSPVEASVNKKQEPPAIFLTPAGEDNVAETDNNIDELQSPSSKDDEAQVQILQAFRARSMSVPLIQGSLSIRSKSMFKEWKERWFVLSLEALRCYKRKDDVQPLEVIRLLNCSVKVCDRRISNDCKDAFHFEITTPGGNYMLAASTAEQMHMWVSGIRGSNSFLLAQSSLASPRVASTNGKEDQRKQCEAEKHKQTEADDVEDSAKSATVDKADEMESKESKGDEDKEKYKTSPPSTTKLATSSGATKPVTIDSFRREGHLYKKGNSVRPWRLCWFTMTRTELNFYDNRMDSSPKGSINLLTCSVLPGASDVNTSNQARKKDKPFSFSIIAPDRTYVVAAESEMERAEWIRALRGANEILLQGLELESPRSPLALNSSSSSQGIGEIVLSGLLKKQGKSIRKDWKSRWCVLTREFFYYYKSKNDVEPKGTINLLLCSATPSRHGHFGFDVTIPARVYYFRASDGMEMTNWINSIRDMGEALLNELPAERRDTLNLTRILAKNSEEEEENSAVAEIMTLAQLPTNKQCADCGEEEPRWVSINIGIFLCIMCSGIHRSLGVHISKVRSVDLDAWESRTVEFMREMGNEKSNQIFEYFVPPQYEAKRPKPADSRAKKEEWIRLKYVEKAFLKDSPLAHSLPVEVPPQPVEEENNSTTTSPPPDGVDLETAAGGVGDTTTKRVYWEGYLTKQGNSIKSWKTRWFVLRDYLLYYFKTLGDFQPAGMIDLGYATVRRTQTKKQYSFEIITPQRIYPIYASNKRNLDEWMENLQQAITLFYDVPRQEHALDGSGGPTSIGSGGAADGAESQEALLSNCLDALSKSAKKNKKAGMEKQRSRRSLDKVKRREVSQHFDKQQHRKGHTRQKSHDGSFINWASEVIKPVKKQQSAEQLFSKAGVEGGGAAIKRKQKESSSPTTEETHSPAVQSRSYSLVERGSDAMEFQSPLFTSGGGGDGGEMMGSGELLHPSIGGSNSGMPSNNNGSLLSAVASWRRRPVHTLTKIDDAGEEGDRSRSADNIRGALLQEIQRQKRAADY